MPLSQFPLLVFCIHKTSMEASSILTDTRRGTITTHRQAEDESCNAEVFRPAPKNDFYKVPSGDKEVQGSLTIATPAYQGPYIDPIWELPNFHRPSSVRYPQEPYKPPCPEWPQIMTGEHNDDCKVQRSSSERAMMCSTTDNGQKTRDTKSLPPRGSLPRHSRSALENTRQFKCNHCLKRFKRRYELDRHLRIHSTTQAFRCLFCKHHFSRKDSLQVRQTQYTSIASSIIKSI